MAARLILHTDELDPATLERFAAQARETGSGEIRGGMRSRRPVLVAEVRIDSSALRELMRSHAWRHLVVQG
jgi:hypothetical protein